MNKPKSKFLIFAEEVVKASYALGLSHIRKVFNNNVPEGYETEAEDGMQACFFYRRDQNFADIYFNPDCDDDPRYDAWHEMVELSLVDIEQFCRDCAKTGRFNKSRWESLAHAQVNRTISAARPELSHIVCPPPLKKRKS